MSNELGKALVFGVIVYFVGIPLIAMATRNDNYNSDRFAVLLMGWSVLSAVIGTLSVRFFV